MKAVERKQILLIIMIIGVDGGEVGLAISNCIMLTGMLQWGVRQSAEVENLMTSVERVRKQCPLYLNFFNS